MSKYTLIVRRHAGEDWSAWCNTDDEDKIKHAIEIVDSYGWQWTLEDPMFQSTFKATCYALGINNKLTQAYCKGRIKFVTDDIEELKRRATNG
jgi:hypothetical protein